MCSEPRVLSYLRTAFRPLGQWEMDSVGPVCLVRRNHDGASLEWRQVRFLNPKQIFVRTKASKHLSFG
jgi:hypothetical protein